MFLYPKSSLLELLLFILYFVTLYFPQAARPGRENSLNWKHPRDISMRWKFFNNLFLWANQNFVRQRAHTDILKLTLLYEGENFFSVGRYVHLVIFGQNWALGIQHLKIWSKFNKNKNVVFNSEKNTSMSSTGALCCSWISLAKTEYNKVMTQQLTIKGWLPRVNIPPHSPSQVFNEIDLKTLFFNRYKSFLHHIYL